MKKLSLVLLFTLCGCGTLSPPKPPELPGRAISPVRRFFVSLITQASASDEVFDGATVETLDAADVASEAVSDAVSVRSPELGAIVKALISAQQIEVRGPRAWAISVTGDPVGAPPRWFIVRPKIRGAGEISTLPANTPVRIYAQRIEVPGFSALIVTRWSKL